MVSSLVEPVTVKPRRALAGYAAVATAARLGDAGAGIGVVLLAVDRLGPTRGALVGGLLTAALTAPHALGPWTGRLLDRRADRRPVLAAACVLYGVALAAGTVLLGAGAPGWSTPCLALAGATGPLLTGGFSSLVRGLGTAIGRARGIDAVTYGVAGTAGPALVAALATAASASASLLLVAALVAAAGVGVFAVPVRGPDVVGASRPARRTDGGWLLLRSRPLRQVTVSTVAAAGAGGALGVVAVLLAGELTGRTGGGAWFVTALGVGNLVGAIAVAWRPLHGEPVRSSLVLAASLGVADTAVALVPTPAVGLAVFAVVGLLTAPWVTATLAARERNAPDGRQGEVFVAMAGVKVAGSAGGAALAGIASGWGARPLAVAAGLLALAAVAAVTPRSASRER